MSKAVAIKGALIAFEPITVQGQDQVSPESQKLLVGGKGVYAGEIQLTISTISNIVDGSAAPGTFNGKVTGTAAKLVVEGKKAVLLNDMLSGGNDSGAAMKPGSTGSPEPSPISFSRKVADSGQTKFMAS